MTDSILSDLFSEKQYNAPWNSCKSIDKNRYLKRDSGFLLNINIPTSRDRPAWLRR